ncbi:PREDICTED: phosphatidylcholine transfer protein-like [Ceratotherium simum simum]|uniref:Phosphatidylcholine transfer protein-like n=1 Tax=Ceratotherium simum simum TaxID=73337 RepID=A0ABM1D2S3_CERSS|nr:PREDICTED: phosphatidylcholine transfer protein-like [Ceratotherium simum simum]
MAGAAGGFSEEQFREACAELRHPVLAVAGWELLVEAMGISIYRLRDQVAAGPLEDRGAPGPPSPRGVWGCGRGVRTGAGLLELGQRAQGRCLPLTCPGQILRKWQAISTALKSPMARVLGQRKRGIQTPTQQQQQESKDLSEESSLELYEKECNGQTMVYLQVRCPFSKPNRDYVYIRERRELDVEGRKIYVVLAQSTSHPEFPERSGVIRVTQYKESLVLTSDGGNGSKVFMYYFDNLGGEILTRLINWAAKKGVPEFLKDLAKACRNYPGRT